MFNYSELRLLNSDLPLMIWMRTMEVISIALFILTIRVIKIHSTHSMGSYKYCLYQIVIMAFLSQFLSILGPVFCVPLLGGYVTVEVIVDPLFMHLIFSLWLVLVCFDLTAIMDGFNYRCRVLLTTFYPQFSNKTFWIGYALIAKAYGLLGIGVIFVPIGFDLKRDEMKAYILKNFPYVLPVFETRSSFYVYDQDKLHGNTIGPVLFFVGVLVFTAQCALAIILACWIVRSHRCKMSTQTRRMHANFIRQLLFQACVPFLVIICPVATFIILLLIELPLQTNICGHIILAVMLTHGPLTSLMTIVLYSPYREAVFAAILSRGQHAIPAISLGSRV